MSCDDTGHHLSGNSQCSNKLMDESGDKADKTGRRSNWNQAR